MTKSNDVSSRVFARPRMRSHLKFILFRGKERKKGRAGGGGGEGEKIQVAIQDEHVLYRRIE